MMARQTQLQLVLSGRSCARVSGFLRDGCIFVLKNAYKWFLLGTLKSTDITNMHMLGTISTSTMFRVAGCRFVGLYVPSIVCL